jgi:hypothetical protein
VRNTLNFDDLNRDDRDWLTRHLKLGGFRTRLSRWDRVLFWVDRNIEAAEQRLGRRVEAALRDLKNY